MGVLSFLGGLIKPVTDIIDEAVTDKDEANRIKASIQQAAMDGRLRELEEAAETIRAEATGRSWLQRTWRPITMLTFVGLIVARWFGFTVEGIDATTEQALLEIVKVGLGGYVIGRSAEKVTQAWKGKGDA